MSSDNIEKVENNKSENQESDTPSFTDLANMMKRMGGMVGNITNDLNDKIAKAGDIYSKLGETLSEEDKLELQKMYLKVSKEDEDHLWEMIQLHDIKGAREWLEDRCDNEKLVDSLLSSLEICEDVIDVGDKFTQGISDIFGQFFPENQENIKSMFGDIFNSGANFQTQKSKTMKNQPTDDLYDYDPEEQYNYTRGHEPQLKEELLNNESDSDNEFSSICKTINVMSEKFKDVFDDFCNDENTAESIMTTTLSKMTDLTDEEKDIIGGSEILNEINNISEVIKDQFNSNIRMGLVCDASKMIEKHNKLSDDIDNIVSILNPSEIKILEEKCGGELPMNFRLRMMENRIKNLDDKLTESINDPQDDQNNDNQSDARIVELHEKIDDIAVNLDILLSKLSKFLK